MIDEVNQAMAKQKTILIRSALEDFLDSYGKGVDFSESLASGERVLWRDAEKVFKSSFNDSTEKDLLIEIIRDCKGYYHEVVNQILGLWDSPKKVH